MTTEHDTYALYNVPESFYHERSTSGPFYQKDTSAKRLITRATTTTLVVMGGGGGTLAQIFFKAEKNLEFFRLKFVP